MRIAILQLSDIHFQATRKYALDRTVAITAAVCSADNEWDDLLILLTGDIASTGLKAEYKFAVARSLKGRKKISRSHGRRQKSLYS